MTGPYPRDYAYHDERIEPVEDRPSKARLICLGIFGAVAPIVICIGFIVKGAA